MNVSDEDLELSDEDVVMIIYKFGKIFKRNKFIIRRGFFSKCKFYVKV